MNSLCLPLQGAAQHQVRIRNVYSILALSLKPLYLYHDREFLEAVAWTTSSNSLLHHKGNHTDRISDQKIHGYLGLSYIDSSKYRMVRPSRNKSCTRILQANRISRGVQEQNEQSTTVSRSPAAIEPTPKSRPLPLFQIGHCNAASLSEAEGFKFYCANMIRLSIWNGSQPATSSNMPISSTWPRP